MTFLRLSMAFLPAKRPLLRHTVRVEPAPHPGPQPLGRRHALQPEGAPQFWSQNHRETTWNASQKPSERSRTGGKPMKKPRNRHAFSVIFMHVSSFFFVFLWFRKRFGIAPRRSQASRHRESSENFNKRPTAQLFHQCTRISFQR